MPLVADIHFQPAVAMMVAEAFEKVSTRRVEIFLPLFTVYRYMHAQAAHGATSVTCS